MNTTINYAYEQRAPNRGPLKNPMNPFLVFPRLAESRFDIKHRDSRVLCPTIRPAFKKQSGQIGPASGSFELFRGHLQLGMRPASGIQAPRLGLALRTCENRLGPLRSGGTSTRVSHVPETRVSERLACEVPERFKVPRGWAQFFGLGPCHDHARTMGTLRGDWLRGLRRDQRDVFRGTSDVHLAVSSGAH